MIFSFGKGRRLLKVGTMEVDGLGGIDDDDADDDQNQDDGDEYIGDGHQDDDGDGKMFTIYPKEKLSKHVFSSSASPSSLSASFSS